MRKWLETRDPPPARRVTTPRWPPDAPIHVPLPILRPWRGLGAAICLAWTCPACGEPIIYPVANFYDPDAYTHHRKHDGTTCGHHYTGDLFGLVALYMPPSAQGPSRS